MRNSYLVVLCTGGPDHPHRLFDTEEEAVAYARSDAVLEVPGREWRDWVNDNARDPVLFVKIVRFVDGMFSRVVYTRDMEEVAAA